MWAIGIALALCFPGIGLVFWMRGAPVCLTFEISGLSRNCWCGGQSVCGGGGGVDAMAVGSSMVLLMAANFSLLCEKGSVNQDAIRWGRSPIRPEQPADFSLLHDRVVAVLS